MSGMPIFCRVIIKVVGVVVLEVVISSGRRKAMPLGEDKVDAGVYRHGLEFNNALWLAKCYIKSI